MKDSSLFVPQIRSSLETAAKATKTWFENSATEVKKESLSRNEMGDNGKGAVYVYYNSLQEVIYVGQTSRYVKSRLYDKTSPHQKKDWWEGCTTVRFVSMNKETDRLVLEFLLILAYSSSQNLKPKSQKIEELFINYMMA